MAITDHKIVDLDSLTRYHDDLMTNVVDKIVTVQQTQPDAEHTQIWVSDNGTSVELPQISDTSVSTKDTWSSNKISGELTTLKNGIATNADIQSLFGGDE